MGALLLAAPAVRATPPRTVGFIESARVHVGHPPVGLAVGDMDGDGRPDDVVVNDDSTHPLLFGDGVGGLGAARDTFVGFDLAGVALADLDHDGRLDVAVSAPTAGAVFTWLGTGDGGLGTFHALAGPWSPGVLVILDLERDRPDLLVADLFFQSVVVAHSTHDGSFAFANQFAGFADPVGIAAGEVTHDALPDVAVADATSHLATVVDDIEESAFAVRRDQPLAGRPFAVGMGDLDRDGHDDVVVATRSPGTLAVCRGAADGSLLPAHEVPAEPTPVALVLRDLDGDGKLDVAVADHDLASIAVWLGRGNGTFVRLGSIPTGAGPVALALGDLNGDGWPDLVCANHDDGTVQVLLNTSAPRPGTVHLFAPTPNPASSTSLITFQLSASASVHLDVHDLTGRLVRRLVDGEVMAAGPHVVAWDARTDERKGARSGVFFVRLRAGGADLTTRLVLGR
jgi:hypothetical protein